MSMSEADLPAGPHARRLLVALCFGFSIFLDTKCPVVRSPATGESRDTASERHALGLGHLVCWPLVSARLLCFVAYTAAPLGFCVYQADHILPLPCPLPAMDFRDHY